MISPQSSLQARSKGSKASSILLEKLAPVLLKGQDFGIYHLSTPPTKSDALYNPPPGTRPDKTYCEQHFLAITIPTASPPSNGPLPPALAKRPEVLVLAIEIYIYTTAYSSTFFVSKADSTGYLSILQLPKGTRPRSARSPQPSSHTWSSNASYLFPGSVKNKSKHVLDDRGLVRWWCRVLDPLLAPRDAKSGKQERRGGAGYLIVPGLDDYETRAFLPRAPSSNGSRWVVGHPLESISHYCQEYDWVPPRCLIPKYPDDPKSRFRDELDEESANWKNDIGAWKSVKSLEQFWEMMAFRQECSSGRLTGFIWVVFDDQKAVVPPPAPLLTPNVSFNGSQDTQPPTTPPRRPAASDATTPKATPNKKHETPKPKRKKKLRGLIVPRQPRIKREQRDHPADQPAKTTAYYHWPLEGRGAKIVDEDAYKRGVELLLHLDFPTLEKGVASTARWVGEVGMGREWRMTVSGSREAVEPDKLGAGAQVNNLSNMIKRKREPEQKTAATENGAAVNVLDSSLVRKKRKSDEIAPAVDVPDAAPPEAPKVNMLGSSLVRKKPKPA